MSYPKRTIADRLALYSARAESGCLEWQRKPDKNGYGRLVIVEGSSKKTLKAHRLAYEVHVGPIPSGMMVCHTCDNPSCIEPSHLFVGTAADNNADKMRKGRYRPGGKPHPGESNGRAKLTSRQVAGIRKLTKFGISGAAIARSLGVCASAVQRAAKETAWKSFA